MITSTAPARLRLEVSLLLTSLVGFVSLILGAYFVLSVYLPANWVLSVFGEAELMRFFPSMTLWGATFPLFGLLGLTCLALGAGAVGGSAVKARRSKVGRGTLAFFVVTLVLAIIVSSSVAPAFAAISSSEARAYNRFDAIPCTYLIFTDGTNYYGQNCATGNIDYGGSANAGGVLGKNASAVIDDALAKGGHIQLAAGQYVLSASASLYTGWTQNGWLSGDGRSTNVTTAASFSADIVIIAGNGWTVSNLAVDGRHQTRAGSYAGIDINSRNDTVEGVYVSNTDHCGIDSEEGNQYNIENNFVYNSNDDGICIRNTGGVVTGNTVQKTTNHNCFSIVVATRVTLSGNNCYHSGLVGIAVEGNTVTDATIVGNTVVSAALGGLEIFSKTNCAPGQVAQNITISGNTFAKSGYAGIHLASGSCGMENVAITGNTIVGVNSTLDSGFGIQIDGTSGPFRNIVLNSNMIEQTASLGIVISNEGTAAITGLTIDSNYIQNGEYNSIDIENANHFSIVGNTADSPSSGDGVVIRAPSTYGVISSNTLVGAGNSSGAGVFLTDSANHIVVSNNVVNSYDYGLIDASSSDYNQYLGNILSSVTYPVTVVGSHDVVQSNLGFNPVGKITNPWGPTTVGYGGKETTPGASGGTYTLTLTSLSFACSGGGTVGITVRDALGNALASAYTCSTLPTTFYPPGYELTVTNSSAFSSFTAYGN